MITTHGRSLVADEQEREKDVWYLPLFHYTCAKARVRQAPQSYRLRVNQKLHPLKFYEKYKSILLFVVCIHLKKIGFKVSASKMVSYYPVCRVRVNRTSNCLNDVTSRNHYLCTDPLYYTVSRRRDECLVLMLCITTILPILNRAS